MAAAADLRISTCPMSGFQPEKVHEILNLPTNEQPVAYLAVGNYPENEADANHLPKQRLELSEIVRFIN